MVYVSSWTQTSKRPNSLPHLEFNRVELEVSEKHNPLFDGTITIHRCPDGAPRIRTRLTTRALSRVVEENTKKAVRRH